MTVHTRHSQLRQKRPLRSRMSAPAGSISSSVNSNEPPVKWSVDDEKAMIQYLVDNKALAGDGTNYKDTVWNGVAALLETQRTEGGVKTAKKCREKWGRVSASFVPFIGDLDQCPIAAEYLQNCHFSEEFIWFQLGRCKRL
jgi:hypothetical protein